MDRDMNRTVDLISRVLTKNSSLFSWCYDEHKQLPTLDKNACYNRLWEIHIQHKSVRRKKNNDFSVERGQSVQTGGQNVA